MLAGATITLNARHAALEHAARFPRCGTDVVASGADLFVDYRALDSVALARWLRPCLAHRLRVTSEESALKTVIISVVLLTLLGATGAGVSAPPGAPGGERFVLTGLVVWSGKEGVAWLQEPDLTRNQIVTLRIGESVGPWKLTRFLDNGVELEGPAGKVLIPLQNVGSSGTAVAAGAPAAPAPAAASTASAVATPPVPDPPVPAFVWESNRPAPNAGALGEALNKALAERAQRQAGSPQDQRREAGRAGSQAARGPSTPSGVASFDGASGAGPGGTNEVIQWPVGGGKEGFRELFGPR